MGGRQHDGGPEPAMLQVDQARATRAASSGGFSYIARRWYQILAQVLHPTSNSACSIIRYNRENRLNL